MIIEELRKANARREKKRITTAKQIESITDVDEESLTLLQFLGLRVEATKMMYILDKNNYYFAALKERVNHVLREPEKAKSVPRVVSKQDLTALTNLRAMKVPPKFTGTDKTE